MPRRATRALSVSVLTCALVLTGCSGQGATTGTPTVPTMSAAGVAATATAPSSAGGPGATDSDAVAGRSNRFTVVPPEAWGDATSQAGRLADLELVLLSSRAVGSFSTNLVVTAKSGELSGVWDELATGRTQLAGLGRTVSGAPDKLVGGERATGFTSRFEQEGVAVVARSYGLHRDGRIYLLTLSSAEAEADHAMAELDELLSTWTWT
ncbi:hypothetical protein N865_03885 [Intrasporangium oryzae NRRL B-24470]|uniref:Serine/threonine protein kinase n=1 Tax=Intrasporangium oryzae NRRL B-24470 TaxID=1386089 RepID=W9GGT3_9MICO|nr:hypothetical protein [Intrasporangium oryzae]EWT03064.1 hypothetical protein N865_03885 [Intrasporangium oryzae NRRL B-24470]